VQLPPTLSDDFISELNNALNVGLFIGKHIILVLEDSGILLSWVSVGKSVRTRPETVGSRRASYKAMTHWPLLSGSVSVAVSVRMLLASSCA